MRMYSTLVGLEDMDTLVPGIQSLSPLGEGGQGKTFLAETVDGDKYVVKLYEPEMFARARAEVEKLLRISNPYIMRLVRADVVPTREGSKHATVAHYICGDDLCTHIRSGNRLSEHEAICLGRCVASAIDALRTVGMVHRDIKPANVIRVHPEHYVLIDFGYARHLDMDTLTAKGGWVGTPGYMAPEQYQGTRYPTIRVDLFALGILLYECLTGQHPFGGRQDLVGLKRPEDMPFPDGISPKLRAMICALLQAEPSRRPISGSRAVLMLEGS